MTRARPLAQRAISNVAVVAAVLVAFWLGRVLPRSADEPMSHDMHASADGSGEGSGHAAAPEEYVCPMHPQVRQDHMGTCPICHMDLVPVAPSAGGSSDVSVTLSDAAVALAQVRVQEVTRTPVTRTLELQGRVAASDDAEARITAWTAGRIERLYVDTVGEHVDRGDRLARIYSPELVVAQETLVHALDALDAAEAAGSDARARAARASIDAARAELRLLGMSGDDIDDVARDRVAHELVTVHAPASGTVMERFVREGDHVAVGAPIVALADLDTVRVELEVFERDLHLVSPGQAVTLSWTPFAGASSSARESFEGRVDFVEPVVDPVRRVGTVWVSVPNDDGDLRPDQYVVGAIDVSPQGRPPVTVPRSAVLWTGERSLVYVYDHFVDPPVYQPVEVVLGDVIGDRVVIETGVWPGETVVVNGAFRIDAELQIRGGASMMQGHAPGHDVEGAP